MEIMAEMRSDISGVVESTVIETFNGMLGQNVVTAALQRTAVPGPAQKVYACLLLDQQKGVSANFCFTFDDDLLSRTAAAFYPKGQLDDRAVRDDIACAVANIVGSKVKTCLNKHGYDFQMAIPFVAEPTNVPHFTRDDIIHVHFAYGPTGGKNRDDAVVVNFLLEGHRAGNC